MPCHSSPKFPNIVLFPPVLKNRVQSKLVTSKWWNVQQMQIKTNCTKTSTISALNLNLIAIESYWLVLASHFKKSLCQGSYDFCLLDILHTGNIYKYDWYSSRVESRGGSIHSRTMHQGLVNTPVAAVKETIKNSVEYTFHFRGWVYFVTWLRMVHNLSFHSAKLSRDALPCDAVIRLLT